MLFFRVSVPEGAPEILRGGNAFAVTPFAVAVFLLFFRRGLTRFFFFDTLYVAKTKSR